MAEIWSALRRMWLYMLESPWRHPGPADEINDHWITWVFGWLWVLAGVVLGALLAPTLIQFAGLENAPYRDGLDVGVAVLMGFLAQSVGWCLVFLFALAGRSTGLFRSPSRCLNFAIGVAGIVLLCLPLAGVGYGIHRYFVLVGAGQRSVTIAFVGALLFKTFLVPAIKSTVTGAALKWLIGWLRGDKAKPRGA